MNCASIAGFRRLSCGVGCVAVLLIGVANAQAEVTAPEAKMKGRIDFSQVNLPTATVELDINQALFSDLLGLGDAAIDGVIDGLLNAKTGSDGSQAMGIAAEKLGEAKELIKLVQDVIYGVQVRVYENLPEEQGNANKFSKLFTKQLQDAGWERVLSVKDGDDSVQLSIVRVEGAILGFFAVVADGNDFVLVNVVGDISPEKVKKLTSMATKIALENGLHKELEREIMRSMK